MSDDLLMRAIAWRNGENTGMSSIALVSYLMGWPNGGTAYPHDSGDFNRCVQALNAIPGLRDKLDDARTLSPQWNALIGDWAELEDLLKRDRSRDIYARMGFLTDIYCRRGCGELTWESERSAKCAVCGSTVGGVRDPRLPEPEEEPKAVIKPDSIRASLVVRYLLVDDTGAVIDGTEDCEECDGEGEVTCDYDCEHDCEECDGTGKVKSDGSVSDDPPIAGEGEKVIIAIVDERNPKGPRVAYPTLPAADHALQILLEQPDSVLANMFTERKAA